MEKIKFWVWKNFHRNKIHCKHFCGNCEYYELCKIEKGSK